MATINVSHNHTLGQDEAKRRIETLLSELGHKVKADINWSGPNASFKGTGFSGTAQVLDDKIHFELDLNMLLRPMKGKIEARVEKILSERFT
jgi:putative polyhydroxyalkanoate system protein